MAGVLKKPWMSAVRHGFGIGVEDDADGGHHGGHQQLGILAFETAKTMSRLLSLHRSLSDSEINNLRTETIRSAGVAYLNSTDRHFLLQLAAAEMVDQLDRVAEAITRLSTRSGRKAWTREFHDLYAQLKNGIAMDLHLGFSAKEMEKKMKKIEKYLISTSNLHVEMEVLAEMEASEKKLDDWRNYSGPITPSGTPASTTTANPPGAEIFLKKIALQRKRVNKIKQDSLWKKSYETVTVLMGKATITIFCKICSGFSHVAPDLPATVLQRDGRYKFSQNSHTLTDHGDGKNPSLPRKYYSGPLDRPPVSGASYVEISGPIVRTPGSGKLYRRNSSSSKRFQVCGAVFRGNSGPLFISPSDTKSWVAKTLEPGRNTVGSSGMAIRYAEVITALEMMLLVPETVGDDARIELYRMLPTGIQKAVRAKLRRKKKKKKKARYRGESDGDDELMAEGWREAALDILKWLGPMAKDTSTWQSERSCERRKLFDEDEKKVLMLQTLFFSDREKAEAAIVEVLVGLSCVCKYGGGRGEEIEDWD